MSKSKHKTGHELQIATDMEVGTYRAFINYLEDMPVSDVNTVMIQYFKDEIKLHNGTPNCLRLILEKDRAIKFLEFEKTNK